MDRAALKPREQPFECWFIREITTTDDDGKRQTGLIRGVIRRYLPGGGAVVSLCFNDTEPEWGKLTHLPEYVMETVVGYTDPELWQSEWDRATKHDA